MSKPKKIALGGFVYHAFDRKEIKVSALILVLKSNIMMLRTIFLVYFLLLPAFCFAQDFIPLWPDGKMPNSKGLKLEHVEERERITQVETPGLYTFFPSKEENKGSAVIICPPGGYQKLTYNIAGFQWAKWFNTMGVSAFVLIYRLPTSPDLIERQYGPLQDAQRAMKIVRSNSEKWGIDKNKIGVMGASAGGHLAACLSTIQKDFSKIGDSLDVMSFHPDFQILVSPVINMGEFTHEGRRKALLGDQPAANLIVEFSCEQKVNTDTPPAFLVHADDDKTVPAMNSVLYYQALRKNKIPASLHIFPHGGHSIALRNNPGSTQQWTILCEAWLKETGFL